VTIDRRRFVGAVAGGLAFPSAAIAQFASREVFRVGFLLGATAESTASLFDSLNEGLRDLGYIEGRNLIMERRYGNGNMGRLPDLAAELVRARVEVIVTGTNIHVAAVRKVTTTVPTVMVFTADPVAAGFVANLARPGGNVTGLSADASPEVWAKYLGLLKEVVPRLSRVGAFGQVSSTDRLAKARHGARGRRPSQPRRVRWRLRLDGP
jgi:putative ABC transport system substrate-binding protein